MAGTGATAILLLHETPTSSRSFVPAMPALASAGCAIALDTPGYGASFVPAGTASIESYAEAIWEAICRLGIDRVALCGIHTGAAIAIAIAARARAGPAIAGLVLSGIPLIDADSRVRLERHIAHRRTLEGEAALLDAWRDRAGRWRGASHATLMETLADEMMIFQQRDAGLEAVLAYGLARDAARVTAPVLVLNGAQDSLGASDAAHAITLLPAARLHILPDHGGQLPSAAPDTYAHAVLDFVLPLMR